MIGNGLKNVEAIKFHKSTNVIFGPSTIIFWAEQQSLKIPNFKLN